MHVCYEAQKEEGGGLACVAKKRLRSEDERGPETFMAVRKEEFYRVGGKLTSQIHSRYYFCLIVRMYL